MAAAFSCRKEGRPAEDVADGGVPSADASSAVDAGPSNDAGAAFDAGPDASFYSLSRVAAEPIAARVSSADLALLEANCQTYCQARVDGGCDAGASIGAGLNLTIARPEIAWRSTDLDGGKAFDHGIVVYTLRESSQKTGFGVIRSPACQHRQQAFHFNRADKVVSFNDALNPCDSVFDFLPELPDAGAGGVVRDFCSTRDTRLSEAADGGVWAATQITIGEVKDGGACSDAGLEDWNIFSAFRWAADASAFAAPALDDVRSLDGPGNPYAVLACGTQQNATDDIPTAVISGDFFAATYCTNLLDSVGAVPRSYAVLRKAPASSATKLYAIPLYSPDGGVGIPPVWLRVGGKQGSLIDDNVAGRAVALFVYAATPPGDAGIVAQLAWFKYDFDADGGGGDFVRDGGAAVVGGYVPRPDAAAHVVEKYALGLVRDEKGNAVIFYLTEEATEYCAVLGTSMTTCYKDDTGHLRARVVDPKFTMVLADVSVARGDSPSSVDPGVLLMAPTHPDVAHRSGFFFLTFALVHYPMMGCGADAGEPCRGKNDIVTQTSVVEVWQIDAG